MVKITNSLLLTGLAISTVAITPRGAWQRTTAEIGR